MFTEAIRTVYTLTTQYVGKNFYVDVVVSTDGLSFESWIYTSDYGIKMLMFGGRCDNVREALDLTRGNFKVYADAYFDEIID